MNNEENSPQTATPPTTSNLATWLTIGLCVVGLVGLFYSGLMMLTPTSETDSVSQATPTPSETAIATPSIKSAVIIDQLGRYYPNPTLIEDVTTMLEQADYAVTYIPNEAVTIDFFRTLPQRGDRLILMRAHGTAVRRDPDGTLIEQDFTYLATGEPIVAEDYVSEIRRGWLTRFIPDNPDEPHTFMLTDGFLRNGMKGFFNNSVILMMGCDGLRNPATPRLFIQRGAQAVVGWTDNVSVQYMDKATEQWLEAYLINEQSVIQATQTTHEVVGIDPYFKAELRATVVGD